MAKLAAPICAIALTFLSACGGGNDNNGNNDQDLILPFASSSAAVAISPDDSIVVTVNENADSISVFDAKVEPPALIKEVQVGDEPVAVAIGPDNQTAFVVNQADATISKIIDLKTNPRIGGTGDTGSEPVAIALSPTGRSLFVSELTQGRVAKYNADSLDEIGAANVAIPFGLSVTNDLDTDDNDETVVVTRLYGRPRGLETADDSRIGVVQLLRASDLGGSGEVTFNPRGAGVDTNGNGQQVTASPNQLYSVAVLANRFFATTVSASPTGPVQVRGGNLHPIVLAGSIGDKKEIAGLSFNLEQKIQELQPDETGTRNFLSDTSALSFSRSESSDEATVLYTVSRGGDAIQRVQIAQNGSVSIDSFDQDGAPDQVDLFPKCRTPMGIAVASGSPKAFVNCRGTRRLVSVDLGQQSVLSDVATSTAPAPGTDEFDVERGQLLFFTARARWSTESRSDCAACHTNGSLSDNITWSFGTGPRRTVPMHWSYADLNGDGVKETQRAFNWTAINDEVRDFEGNVIGVSGGAGVLTPAKNNDVANNCASLANQDPSLVLAPVNLVAKLGLGLAVIDLEEDNEARLCAPEDWDEVDAYVRTLRSPRAPKSIGEVGDSVARGRQLFAQGGCAQCHGGPAWTVSRVFYDVNTANIADLATDNPQNFDAFNDQPLIDAFGVGSTNVRHIQLEGDPVNGNTLLQLSCVLRNVGTFGDPDSAAVTALLEIKNGGPALAEGGLNGYNVPSLLGGSLNAPYFHHGLAETLDELLTDPTWADHLKSGNPDFDLNAAQAQDLENFLLAIDTDTPAFPAGDLVDVCPDLGIQVSGR